MKNIEEAFAGIAKGDESCFEDLEYEYGTLLFCKKLISSDYILHTEEGEVEMQPSDFRETSLNAYLRFIRWRIDRARQLHGMQIKVYDAKETFLDLPFMGAFRVYLRNLGKGYERKSVNGHTCKLRRFYNLYLRRVMKIDGLTDLKYYIGQGEPVNQLLDKVESMIDYKENADLAPEISYDDFSRGKKAFSLYKNFIADYVKSPDKYSRYVAE